ncbi:hypothetical protein [Kribbella shirazensis]|uniref:Uncharacterized protein n=1 Tax=Kribbella shirazensis TaxID=1105143 RepID=A0A7X6A138_9ACTN|nr:hypothetical protein [Kribbella shirazensis]NIK57603.1 hypothetical protein [Kribbella shirazensis]
MHGYDDRGRKVLDYLPGTAYRRRAGGRDALAIPLDPEYQAGRLRLMASSYGGTFTPLQLLEAAPVLAERSARVMRAGQLAGNPGMLNLTQVGEPERTERRLAVLRDRIPQIAACL